VRIAPEGGRVLSYQEGPTRLSADVDAAGDGVLVWSRTYFAAWRASVDGRAVEPVLAEGHVVGIPVAAGRQHVEVSWSRTPLLAGIALFFVGVVCAVIVRISS
jgi:uncharacterized membrane protein YfhO